MASKRKSTKKRDPNQITAAGKPDEDQAVAIARTVLRPTVQAAVTLKEYGLERVIINSACDWGVSDPLNVARTALRMELEDARSMPARSLCSSKLSREPSPLTTRGMTSSAAS